MRHVFDAVVNHEENNETCVTVINVMNSVYDELENQIFLNSGHQKKTLSSDNLTKAQGEASQRTRSILKKGKHAITASKSKYSSSRVE